MSRSKRAPYWIEGYGNPDKKLRKRRAARKVRDAEDVPDGAAYRKFQNPWSIADFKFLDTTKDKKVTRK